MRDMGDVLMIISGSYQSIYVKSPAFSTGDFVIKRMSNPNNPLYYVVDGSSGGGCVNILTNPIKYDFCLVFMVTIGYGSFFKDENGDFVKPSEELKKFYKHLVKIASRKTKKIHILGVKYMRVENELISDDSKALEAVRNFYLG